MNESERGVFAAVILTEPLVFEQTTIGKLKSPWYEVKTREDGTKEYIEVKPRKRPLPFKLTVHPTLKETN